MSPEGRITGVGTIGGGTVEVATGAAVVVVVEVVVEEVVEVVEVAFTY